MFYKNKPEIHKDIITNRGQHKLRIIRDYILIKGMVLLVILIFKMVIVIIILKAHSSKLLTYY